uniref:Cilia- and flagella-associated protein 44-like n=1 Tax=Diabrotica virgifera virgifera TaxID=50390 RepID=A0A6P7GKU4_DIAVI
MGWEEFKARRPDPNKNHPDDEKFLQEAMNNVGYYKLKEADDYKPSPDERETTVKKYKQVLDTRLKQYNLRHSFIKSVYDVRDLKYEAIDKLKEYREYLKELHEELPVNLHQFGPNIPDLDPNEFPEEKLKPHVILEEKDESIESGYILEEYVPEPTIHQRERQLLPQRTTYPKINSDNIFIPTYNSNEIANVLEMDFDNLLTKYSDEVDTPMESELRAKRLTRKLFFQSTTIANMNRTIEEFNQVIEEGKKARLPVHPRGNFVDIYILTLNQELNILKQFEDGEDSLQNKVNKCLHQVHMMEDDIDVEKNKKLDIEHEIESNRLEEAKIQEKFKHVTETNKFYDFLKKVFRKRFRPPKQATDSGDITKHTIEQNIKELQRVVDTINKNIEMSTRKLRIVETQYQQSINSLEAYQKEKQRLLNQVRCTVILNLDQIHDYNPEMDEISDYLVFSRSTLSSLYKRVGGLEFENLQQKMKYETYLEHITRMKKDLRYMRSRIKGLIQTIQQMMCEKFGKVVDINELELAMIKKTFNKTHINELEEVVLKKLVFDVRLKNTNIKDVYAAQIRKMTRRIQDCQEDLIRTIQGNTNRLELLQIMNREKKDLVKAIASQSKRRDKLESNVKASAQCDKDIKKLESIVEDQNKTIFNLKAEIKMLKTKGMPPKERYVEPKSTEEVELISESMKEWPEIEKYLESTREEPEERTLQEIDMPGFYLTETEDIITSLIHEILGTMKMKSKITLDAELVVTKILTHILNCVTVQQIINEIVSNIPCELTPKQKSLVESSAEKIFTIQKPDMSEESIIQYAKELLEDSVQEILQKKDEPYELVAELLENLVESMPKEFLFHEKSLNSLVDRLGSFISEHKLERDALTSKIERISSENRNEILAILDVILKEVYGTGIDYMYVIKKKSSHREF